MEKKTNRKKQVSKAPMYEREILEIIKTKFLTKITQIFTYYSGCSERTFYNNNLHEMQTIKKALQDNRTKACQSLLAKWLNSDNPTLQMAAYKILCEDEDRKKLSMTYTDSNVVVDDKRKTVDDLFPKEL